MPKYVIKDPKLAFNDIWKRHQSLQNTFSSSWWFFLFFPRQDKGYGPKQMMFSFGSRAGSLISVNSKWQEGMDINSNNGPIDEFMTNVAGWINDGGKVHENIVHQSAKARLSSREQYLEAWIKQPDGNFFGARIEKSNSHKFGINGHFKGRRGEANFKIWNPGNSELENPQIIDISLTKNRRLGGSRYVRWGKFAFEGDFTTPESTEQLNGLGYFQRVLMNIPMLPWLWPYIVFEDGSIFSSFIIYFGLPNFKRKFNFFNQSLERAVIPIMPRSYFFDRKSGNLTKFDTSTVFPIIHQNKHPDFYIHSRSENGDFLKFRINSHGHSQFLLNRRVLKYLWETKYIYNEYMTRMTRVKGIIDGKRFDVNKYGPGWGNIEYTWGMGL